MGRKFGLYDKALFHTNVTEMRWDEATLRYTIKTDRGDSIRARFVIVASGLLAKIQLPKVPGLDKYKGAAFHTSRWRYDITGGSCLEKLDKLGDKRVAIIGTGATAMWVECWVRAAGF